MISSLYKQAAQATLLTVLSVAFWKSRQPVIVLTSFLVLAGVIFNTFIVIYNAELDRKRQALPHTGRHIVFALILQIIVIMIMGLFTWVLIYKKAEIFKILL